MTAKSKLRGTDIFIDYDLISDMRGKEDTKRNQKYGKGGES